MRFLVWILAGCLVAPGVMFGQGAIDNLYFSGFLSQGYLKTTDYNYLVNESQEGTAEYTEAALTFMLQPSEKLRIGIQLMGRDFGTTDNGDVRLDWAFADYHYSDRLGFRAGKIRIPFGMYSIGRDVDMLRAPVLLPQAVYYEPQREFTLAFEGVSLYGNVHLGKFGGLDYELFGGAMNVPDSEGDFWEDLYYQNAWGVAETYTTQLAQVYNVPRSQIQHDVYGYSHASSYFPYSWGVAAEWDTPLEGLRWHGSFNKFRTEGDFRVQGYAAAPNPNSITGYDKYEFNERLTWSGTIYLIFSSWEYTHKKFTFVLEGMDFSPVEKEMGENVGGYFMVNYQQTPRLAWSMYFSEYYLDKNDLEGDQFVEQGYPRWYAWDRVISLGFRYDITDHWLVKFEGQGHDGVGGVSYVMNQSLVNQPDGHEQYWMMFLAKTTFHF